LINLAHFIFMDMAQEHEIDVELVVVRHGETESNRTHTIQGHLNTPLSDVGLQQAERLAKHIAETKFDHALSSDLVRALKTGQLILDSNPSLETGSIEEWTVLRERCFGEMEGKDSSLMTDIIKSLNKDQIISWGPAGGETGEQFRNRVREFLRDLGKRVIKLKSEKNKSSMRILVTSHGGFIKDLNMVLVKEFECSMPCQSGEYGKISPNTGVTKFDMKFDDEGSICSVKCTSLYNKDHLEGMEFREPQQYGV